MKRYQLNLNVLNVWSPGLAYILGLALTDGTVDKKFTQVIFYSSDVHILEIAKNVLESTHPIIPHNHLDREFVDKKNGRTFAGKKQMHALHICSKQAAQRFYRLGVVPNKSYVGLYPIVPQDVWWHFFRGILDGDGNVYFSRKAGLRITIAGNKNCILGLQSDLTDLFFIRSTARYIDEDRVKLLDLRGRYAELALTLAYQGSENLRLERKYDQWLEWNQDVKLMTDCLLCDVPIRASKGEKLCPSCRVVRNRLMNRRSDHYKRKGIWMPLRDLCKPEEIHFPVERLDLYEQLTRLYGQRRAKRKTEAIVQQLKAEEGEGS